MGCLLLLQPYQIGAVRQAGSEADKDHKVPWPELPHTKGLVKSKGNGCCGVIPVFMNRHDHLLLDGPLGKTEFGFEMLCSTVDDPFIGLMGNDFINLMEQSAEFSLARGSIRVENAQAAFRHRAFCKGVDPIPIHPHNSTTTVS